MSHSISTLNSEQTEAFLCEKLVSLRLLKNISQAALAENAGVSRRTISRMENGQGVSLDTFIRVMRALGLTDRLETLIPSTDILPIDRVKKAAKSQRTGDVKYKRRRASAASKVKSPTTPWEWGDE